MNTATPAPSRPSRMPRKVRLLWLFIPLYLFLAGCALQGLPNPSGTQGVTGSPTLSPSVSATSSPAVSTPRPVQNPSQPWVGYPSPALTPIRPIPSPVNTLGVPDEVRVMAFLGMDRPAPYIGRTDAILLVFYHPRFSRASLVSLPPDLFVYLPGYTMQRLQIAYAVGGIEQLSSALQYSLGVKIDQWVVVNMDDFSGLVDDLGGLDVHILRAYPGQCGGLPVGFVHLNGQKALCYVRLRQGSEEIDRQLRQQEVFRLIFERLIQGGNLLRLPQLFTSYKESVQTNLTLNQMIEWVPLGLRMGDPGRIGYFTLDQGDLKVWEIPGQVTAKVFLPRSGALPELVSQAIDFVQTPAPLSDRVLTLEHELTTSPTATITFTPTQTGTATQTPTRTITQHGTLTKTRVIPSRTLTRTRTPKNTYTPTATRAAHFAYSYDPDKNGVYGLYTMNLNQEENRLVIEKTSSLLLDDWSYDGQFLVYEKKTEDGTTQLFLVSPEGKNDGMIQGLPTGNNTQATFSPDSQWIVFRNVSTTGQSDLYIIAANGLYLTQLTNDSDNDSEPDWSPDGKNIVFVRNGDIYTMDTSWVTVPPEPMYTPVPKPQPVLLIQVSTSDQEGSPRWFGSFLIFGRKVNGYWDIFKVPVDWSQQEDNLTNDPGTTADNEYDDLRPSWSSDGKSITFVSNRGDPGGRRIYIISANGGTIKLLTHNQAPEDRPHWP